MKPGVQTGRWTDPCHRSRPERCTSLEGRMTVSPTNTVSHQTPGRSPPETSGRSPGDNSQTRRNKSARDLVGIWIGFHLDLVKIWFGSGLYLFSN